MIVCKLAEVARRRKISLYKLRQMSGVSYPTLLKLAHDKAQMFDRKVMDRLCRALRCQPGELIAWKPERFPRLKLRKK